MSIEKQQGVSESAQVAEARAEWVKPEITSFEPVKASQGINYRPQDGISNLT